MAHWAKVNENNIVVQVSVGNNDDLDQGYQWLVDNLGGTWIKTSFNTYGGAHKEGGNPLRKNYAGIGFTYDPIREAFIPPKPFESWILNEETCLWDPPKPKPITEGNWSWNEELQEWQD